MKFLTYYYPGFTICKNRNLSAGYILNEWDLVKSNMRSYFAPTDPIVPLYGYQDSSDFNFLKKEAQLADCKGIDSFIFNYYYDGYRTELETPLKTYSDSINRPNFSLNLMCRMPRSRFPLGPGPTKFDKLIFLNEKEFSIMCKKLLKQYMCRSNYLRIDSKCFVTVYHINGFLASYGIIGFERRINILRLEAQRYGLDLYIVGLFSFIKNWEEILSRTSIKGIDAYSCYVGLPDFSLKEPVQIFEELAANWTSLWKDGMAFKLPVIHPCIAPGWNATARGALGYDPNLHGIHFPYAPVVVGSTPQAFEDYLSSIASLVARRKAKVPPIVFLGTWNEWSEGCYLLPDKIYGHEKLDSVLKVKKRLK